MGCMRYGVANVASTAVTKFGMVLAKEASASISTTLMVGLAGDSVYNSCAHAWSWLK